MGEHGRTNPSRSDTWFRYGIIGTINAHIFKHVEALREITWLLHLMEMLIGIFNTQHNTWRPLWQGDARIRLVSSQCSDHDKSGCGKAWPSQNWKGISCKAVSLITEHIMVFCKSTPSRPPQVVTVQIGRRLRNSEIASSSSRLNSKPQGSLIQYILAAFLKLTWLWSHVPFSSITYIL